MNLILVETDKQSLEIPIAERRAQHILGTLRRKIGGSFDIGHADGRIGKGYLRELGADSIKIAVEWTGTAPPLHPISLICGLPRPQTARRILREATTLGVSELVFCGTDRGEPGYRSSKLWTTDEWQRHLVEGAEQAFNPRLPNMQIVPTLHDAIDLLGTERDRIGLDNYEASTALSVWTPDSQSLALAFGAERGWSPNERDLLRDQGFRLFHLGERVLRLDTAVVAALSVVLARSGAI